VQGASAGAHGAVSCTASACTYSPVFGFVGTDVFSYTVVDTHGATATSTVTVTVLNQAPAASADSATTTEGVAVSLDPRVNDSDPDGDVITVVANGTPAHGAVSCTNATCRYTPVFGFVGTDSFDYTITDTHGATATSTVSVTVLNQTPVAAADTATTTEGVAISFDPRMNDSDPDGDLLVISANTDTAHGDLSCSATSCRYAPVFGFVGTDSFDYTITDTHGATATAAATITVLNQTPVPTADGVSTTEGIAVTLDPRINDVDPDGDAITVSGHGAAAHGDVACSTTACTYSPVFGFVGSDSFSYTITDTHSASATATITVTVLNQAPAAHDDATTTFVRQATTVSVVGNDADPDGDTIAVTGHSAAAHGSVSCSSTACTYTPVATYAGADAFGYTITDAHGATSSASVALTVVDRAPVAGDDATSTPGATAVTVAVLGNDTDADADALAVVAHTAAAHGRVTCGGSSCTYTPAAGYVGADSFRYTARDPYGLTAAATVNVAVTDRAPVAADDSARTDNAVPVTVAVLGNDSDPDGDSLTVVAGGAASNGTVSCTASACTYTPRAGFVGVDSFDYTVSDGRGTTSTATVSVTVGNRAPSYTAEISNDTQTVAVGATPAALRAVDPDADPLTFSLTSGSLPAGVTLRPDGTFAGTATATGSTSAVVTVRDPAGLSDTTTLSVLVANSPQSAVADTTTTPQAKAVQVAVLANDTDRDGDTLTVRSNGPASHGTVACGATSCNYTPAAAFAGVDTFSYTSSDGQGHLVSAQVTVTVTDLAPVVVDDAASTPRQTPVTVPVLDNDSDFDAFAVTAAQPGAQGTVSCSASACTYSPTGAWAGTDTFRYTVTDSFGVSATGTVTVEVQATNRAPQFSSRATNTAQTVAVGSSLAALEATDLDADALTFSLASGQLPPGASLLSDGTFGGAPTAFGHYVATITVADGRGGLDSTTLTVDVPNRPVVAVDDAVSARSGQPLTMTPTANDTDPDGDLLTVTSASTPAHGTVSCSAGTCTYTATATYVGTDSFSYVVSDGHGHTDTGLVSIGVSLPPNYAPSAVNDTASTWSGAKRWVGVLANDTDPDHDALAVVWHSAPSHGSVSCSSTACVYAASATFAGTDTFAYTVSDGHGHTRSATVKVTVVYNRAPVARADAGSTVGSAPLTTKVLANDYDLDGDALKVSSHGASARGTVTCTASTCTFTAVRGWYGTTTYTYTITDSHGHTASATVTVTVKR
jgi:hypothetical protein